MRTQQRGTGIPSSPLHLPLFVPAMQTSATFSGVVSGSAIVGTADSTESERILIYYEGNVYGATNGRSLADRARIAADRLLDRAATSAFMVVPGRALRQVGWFDPAFGITLLQGAEKALASWLGTETLDPRELRFSGW